LSDGSFVNSVAGQRAVTAGDQTVRVISGKQNERDGVM
jgi:hypothetical protein